jgi:hypothetical protein
MAALVRCVSRSASNQSDDCFLGLMACCCPCITYSRNKSRLESLQNQGYPRADGGETFGTDCYIHCLLTACAGFGWVLQVRRLFLKLCSVLITLFSLSSTPVVLFASVTRSKAERGMTVCCPGAVNHAPSLKSLASFRRRRRAWERRHRTSYYDMAMKYQPMSFRICKLYTFSYP